MMLPRYAYDVPDMMSSMRDYIYYSHAHTSPAAFIFDAAACPIVIDNAARLLHMRSAVARGLQHIRPSPQSLRLDYAARLRGALFDAAAFHDTRLLQQPGTENAPRQATLCARYARVAKMI